MGPSQIPLVQLDVNIFSSNAGMSSTTVQVIPMAGVPAFNMSQLPWVGEQSVDAEWAHAIAPGANIVIVEAASGADPDILAATKYAIDNNLGDVISMSFSEAESCLSTSFLADEHAAFQRAVAQGITLVAASGDNGPTQPDCAGGFVTAAGTPASDPLVTAVGGTDLTADPTTGAYLSEAAWANSGGGLSATYPRPAYQAPFQKNNRARGLPDVAWSASQFHPSFIVFHFTARPFAGTSVATPEWAGVVAIADQAAGHRLGAINEALYHAAKSAGAADRFHNLANGNSAWDSVTGLGSPDVANLVAWIAQTSS